MYRQAQWKRMREAMASNRLKVEEQELTQLIKDLDLMEKSLDNQIRELNGVAERVASGWKGSAAMAYTNLQREVNETTRRLRSRLIVIEESMKNSRDGFNQQEMDQMQQFKRMQQDDGGQSKILGMANIRPEA